MSQQITKFIKDLAVTGAKIAAATIDLTTKVTGTLPIANGGTNATTKAAAFDSLSPMTTGGDIIYGGASGTGTRLANGTAGQVLTSGGTTVAPTWSTVITTSSTISTKTANYTIVSGDGTIIADATSAGFTITLPSASTVSGQRFIIKRKDSVVANQVTISGTIDGATDWKLYTINETLEVQSDGSIYTQIRHETLTPITTAVALTITGSTTNPTKATTKQSDKISWYRRGAYAVYLIQYEQDAGTGGAAGSGMYIVGLPDLSADTTLIPVDTVNDVNFPAKSTLNGTVSATNGSTTEVWHAKLYSATQITLYGLSTAGTDVRWGSDELALNAQCHVYGWVEIPISGWKP